MRKISEFVEGRNYTKYVGNFRLDSAGPIPADEMYNYSKKITDPLTKWLEATSFVESFKVFMPWEPVYGPLDSKRTRTPILMVIG